MAAAPRGDEREIDREAEPERERARRESAATRRETLPFPSPTTHQLTHGPGDETAPSESSDAESPHRKREDTQAPSLSTHSHT
jgi:hypothetical protein